MGYSPKGHKESDTTEWFYIYLRMPSTAASWAESCCPPAGTEIPGQAQVCSPNHTHDSPGALEQHAAIPVSAHGTRMAHTPTGRTSPAYFGCR